MSDVQIPPAVRNYTLLSIFLLKSINSINNTACTGLNCYMGIINRQLSRCSTARASNSGFSLVSLTKVEARKWFLFTESSFVLKIKNTWLILLSHFIL